MNPRHDRVARRGGLVSGALALVLSTSLALPARAQEGKPPLSETQKQQFKEHYEKGRRFFDLLKYQEAAEEYEKAYLAAPDPVMLYNIGQCHRFNNQPEEASRFYKSYLRNSPNAPNRADVEKKIAEMEKLAEDRRRQGATPPVTPPNPVTTPPVTPVTPTNPITATPPPPNNPPPVEPPPTPSPDLGKAGTIGVTATSPKEEPPSRTLPMTLLIGGGVLVATSVVVGLVAISKSKQVEMAAADHKTFDNGLENAQKAGKAANAAAIVTGLVGLAAGTTGFILLLRTPSGSQTAAGEGPAPARASLFPIAGPGLAGGGARWVF
jgi:tetratricopeptide (TPR) repeat protein